MAEYYLDLTSNGDDANGGTGWSDAKKTFSGANSVMSAGDILYVKTDSTGTAKDSATGTRTIDWDLSEDNPTQIIGCKDDASNEPPTEAELLDRATDAPPGSDYLPTFESTDGIVTWEGTYFVQGIHLKAADKLNVAYQFDSSRCEFQGCKLDWASWGLYNNGSNGSVIVRDCEIIWNSASQYIIVYTAGNKVHISGGVWTVNTAPNYVFDNNLRNNNILVENVDLSVLGTSVTLVDGSSMFGNVHIRFSNCKLPSSYTFVANGPFDYEGSQVELIACSNDTALGSGESVRDYKSQQTGGLLETSFTVYRSGGADDGADGNYSFKLTPNANLNMPGTGWGIWTPWLPLWTQGDGTSKTWSIFVANDSGADLKLDELECVWASPSQDGDATHEYLQQREYQGTTDVDDDTGSTWNNDPGNNQKFVRTQSPDFEGMVMARVGFMQRAGSPDSVYVDPVIIES